MRPPQPVGQNSVGKPRTKLARGPTVMTFEHKHRGGGGKRGVFE
ncbi:hypothetical protein [Mesorhizobium sp.]